MACCGGTGYGSPIAKNHVAVLDAAGLTLADIVSGHVYLTDMQDFNGMNTIYRQYFSQGPGVRTTLMPNNSQVKSPVRGQASFIAAKTRTSEQK
jgi:enamine deaminase RidA (YjgF/YER057c/UK114 family)